MWKEAQVAERMSLVSAADVGTVAVITVSGLIGPNRTSVTDTEKVRKRPSWTFGTSMTASPFVTAALREVKKNRSQRSCIALERSHICLIGTPGFGPVRNKIAVLRIGLPIRGGASSL